MQNKSYKTYYSEVNPDPNFSELELKILKFWKDNDIFNKSIKGSEEFVFYDGPPFANGLPHYGHLLTGFVKDTYARYQTMLGKKVTRRFGWDCHGLPSEMLAEKELGISGKAAIEKYGIDKFNDYCRSSVLRYTSEWKEYVERQGRWVDFEHDYKTMDLSYMESVLWVFSELYKKGLIYKSVRVMPYSWACETPVSDFETRMDDSYRPKKSKAITVGFRLAEIPNFISNNINNDIKEILLLIWTTTPWTLPSNLALAVGNEIEYSVIRKQDTCYIVATTLANKLTNIIGDECVTKILGNDLVGRKYIPLFDYFSKHDNAFTILHGDFVSIEDGTGIVHIAPGFGEDDYLICKKNGIELVCPIDSRARFTHPIKEYIGQQVFDVEDSIIRILKERKLCIKVEQHSHSYPHCWRTDTPLIYKAVDSWYLNVTDIKDNMIRNNQEINWIPEHIKDNLFGNWIKNARDWSISRNRYWGCPIPVWQSDDPAFPNTEVYGSIKELENAFSIKIDDLHRPFIDALVRPNPTDPRNKEYPPKGSMMRRVPEVLDCWFESGSMPYAQVSYPFKEQEWFKAHFPADFIVEYLAQTRGWFYTLLVLSTALFNNAPFKNCICHGVILGDNSQKLSKRLQNYPDPKDVFQKYGADAMRWYMLSSVAMKGQPIIMDKEASGVKEALRLVIKPFWNAYNFFTLYANIDNIQAEFVLSKDNWTQYLTKRLDDASKQHPVSRSEKVFDRMDVDPDLKSYNNDNDLIPQEFALEANAFLDVYISYKCLNMIEDVKTSLNIYDSVTATKKIADFIEILNNWYIRRSRARFWRSKIGDRLDDDKKKTSITMDDDKQEAYNTLYSVLRLLCLTIAPLMPFISEEIYKGLMKNNPKKMESVHLENFPIYDGIPPELRDACDVQCRNMESVREACNAALHIRSKAKIPIKQPLKTLTFVGVQSSEERFYAAGIEGKLIKDEARLPDYFRHLVQDEVNVKHLHTLGSSYIEKYANYNLSLNLSVLGKRLPAKIQSMIIAAKKGEWIYDKETKAVTILGEKLNQEEFVLKLEPKEEYTKNSCVLSANDALIVLDLKINEALMQEGIAKGIVRTIQQLRKNVGLHILDRIRVVICSQDKLITNCLNNPKQKQYIEEQTLANSLELSLKAKEDAIPLHIKESNFCGEERLDMSNEDGKTVAFILIFKDK